MAHILYAEESSILRQTLSAVLLAEDHEVHTFDDGALAWNHLQTDRPDLVILPIRLQGLDGIELMRRIRATDRLRDVPVVILTDVSDRRLIERAVSLRPRKVLVKASFSLESLLATINSILDGRPVPRRHLDRAATGDPGQAASPAGPPPSSPADDASPEIPAPDAPAPAAPAPAVVESGGMVITDDGIGESVGDGRSTIPVVARRFDPQMTWSGGSTAAEETRVAAAEVGTRLAPNEAMGTLTRRQAAPELEALGRYLIDVAPAERWSDPAIAGLLEPFPEWRRHLARISAVVHGDALSPDADVAADLVERLGPRLGGDVVMLAAAVRRFDEGPVVDRTAIPAFWQHAAAVGSIARRLADGDASIDVDVLWLAGLLHDAARLAALERLNDLAMGTLHLARRCDLPLSEIERRTYGVDLDEVNARLLRTWGLPDPVILAASSVRRDAFDPETGGRPAALLGLAERLAHAAALGDDGGSQVRPIESLAAHLGFSAAAIDRALDGLEPGLHRLALAVASALGVHGTTLQSHAIREASAHMPGVLFLDEDDRPDAARIFMSLAAPVVTATAPSLPGHPVPSVAVLRMETGDEVPLRRTALERIEASRGLPALPVVALVDEDSGLAARAGFEGRRFEMLDPSCSRRTLVEAVLAAARAADDAAARPAAA